MEISHYEAAAAATAAYKTAVVIAGLSTAVTVVAEYTVY